MRRPLALVATVLSLLCATARADRETAELFGKRGDKAAGQKDFTDAVEQYKKALSEDAGYVPAMVGLGDAYSALAMVSEAAQQYRAAVSAPSTVKPFPPAWNDYVARARKKLAELDTAAGETIERVQRRYADDLVTFADKWKTRDRALAERALRRALDVIPNFPPAVDRLAALGASGGKPIAVFDGKSWDHVVPTNDPLMSVSGGILHAGLANKANAVHTSKPVDGDVDIRMEARIAKKLGDTPKFTLMAAEGAKLDALFFGVCDDEVRLEHDRTESGGGRERLWTALVRNVKPAFDPTQWSVYEIKLHGDELIVALNGNQLARVKRPKERSGGKVGFLVQDVSVDVRAFTITPVPTKAATPPR